MNRYIFDENLPTKIVLEIDLIHTNSLGKGTPDKDIWEYAKKENLIIVTKDADFSDRILSSTPPPKVVHIRFGNLKLNDFNLKLEQIWKQLDTCGL